MSAEIEAAVLDGSFTARTGRHRSHRTAPPGSPCPNCATRLQGAFCHACGQSAADLHRSARHLALEAFEGLTHFDGRFWRTVPRLAVQPGQLTRDYISGRRASQIPPLRVFLVTILLLFLAGSLNSGHGKAEHSVAGAAKPMSAEDAKEAADDAAEAARDKAELIRETSQIKAGDESGDALGAWIKSHVKRATQDPERFKEILHEWGHRFAILALPISALMLTVLFVFQRQFYVFDHLVFSMHSLSFQGLLLVPVFLFGGVFGWLLLSPVHLFFHMRRAYQASVFGTLVRMALLAVMSTFAFSFLLVSLLLVGALAMG